jgi:predicted dehydrogenase
MRGNRNADVPTINIGLVGTGFMGKGHAVAYKKVPLIFDSPPARPNLAVVADVSEPLARSAARQFGFDRWVIGWEDLVADETVDVVDITAPNYLHREIALAAAEAGKHIYCEKPLALTAADAKDMYAAVEAAGVQTLVGFNYLKNPATLIAKEMIDSGELGEIYHFRGWFHQDALADPGAPFSWRFERKIAGSGALGDLGAHVIEFARFLIGEFDRVCGLTKTFIAERPVAEGAYGYRSQVTADATKRQVENEDAAHFLVQFEAGATGTIETSRIAQGRKVYLAYEVNGSKGSLYFVHERMNELKVYLASDPPGRRGFKTIILGPEHPYYAAFWPVAGAGLGFEDMKVIEVYQLLEGLARGAPMYPDFYAGWQVSRVVDAVLLSAREGRWVNLDEVA